ncbi:MAG: DMT family transporter [Yoonia sp.]|nr:DMT family transporter [Yoonia sp.]
MSPSLDRILPGIMLMLGFCLTAPLIDVASKLAAATLPVGQITTARFMVQAAIMAPICLALRYPLTLPRAALWQLTQRAFFLIASTYCFVAAVQVMPIADALAIAFVEPFILLILGRLLFQDEVGPRRIMACVVGFAGSLLVIQPSLAAFGLVALYPLGTAFSFAAYMLVTRSLSRRMHPIPMQLHTATVAAAICLPVMVLSNGTGITTLDPVMPQGIAWVWVCGVGVASAIAHLMMTYALRMAPTSTLAPLHYLEIVSAVAFGYLIFSDFPNTLTWVGIGIIVASGLYIIWRERITATTPIAVRPRVH